MDPSTPAGIDPTPPSSQPAPRQAPLLEKPTDDWRQVTRRVEPGPDVFSALLSQPYSVVIALQRRWIVQDGPVCSVQAGEFPPYDTATWMHVPGKALCWVAVRNEWRNVPSVTEAQVNAERAEAGLGPKITTT